MRPSTLLALVGVATVCEAYVALAPDGPARRQCTHRARRFAMSGVSDEFKRAAEEAAQRQEEQDKAQALEEEKRRKELQRQAAIASNARTAANRQALWNRFFGGDTEEAQQHILALQRVVALQRLPQLLVRFAPEADLNRRRHAFCCRYCRRLQ